MLDPSEHLAVRLASDGHPNPIHIEDTETTFAVARTGQYWIVGPAFLNTDRDRTQTTVPGLKFQIFLPRSYVPSVGDVRLVRHRDPVRH
jgi:hypothetical protein